jgi:hypothetical protein
MIGETFEGRRTRLAAIAGAVITAGALATAATASGQVNAVLATSVASGDQVVPGPGDPSAFGDEASFGVRTGRNNLHGKIFDFCCTSVGLYGGVSWSATGTPTAVHVHKGPPGEAGPVVADLPEVRPGTESDGNPYWRFKDAKHLDACRVLYRIVLNPGRYYIEGHTDAYPDGALRAQVAPPAHPEDAAYNYQQAKTAYKENCKKKKK